MDLIIAVFTQEDDSFEVVSKIQPPLWILNSIYI
jgi:hypothetical protein